MSPRSFTTGVCYFVTSETREEVDEKNEEVAAPGEERSSPRRYPAYQRIPALYASKAVEYEELKVLLPEQREITNVLQGLQDNARDSRMTVMMRFSPRDDHDRRI